MIRFPHHCTTLLCNDIISNTNSAGPPNVPFVKKPYRDLDLEVEEPTRTSSASKKTTEKKKEKERRPVGTKQPHQPAHYPTLPSNTVPQQPTPPPIGAHYYQQQPGVVPPQQQAYGGYGAPTYPNQQVYQQQGVPYGGSGQMTGDERTRLLNH